MTIVTEKSAAQNRVEGFALTALFQGLPTYAATTLMLKLVNAREIVGQPYGAAIFVTLASLLHAWLTPWLAARFRRVRETSYEAAFYDASLSFADKIAQWRAQPKTQLQLITTVMMMSLLAVMVASLR